MPISLDEALDELYGVAPEEFVLVRSRLERDLKAGGDGEAAVMIKRLRRPHLAAWACNQLARHDPDAIVALFDATAEVAGAQQRTIGGGDADELRAATRRRQEQLDELVNEGLRMLARHAPKPAQYRDNIAATLDAATLDAEAAGLLRAGRLTQPLLAPAGFGPLDPAFVPGAAPRPARKVSSRERDRAQRDLDRAQQAADALVSAADEADAEVASADLATQSALGHLQEVDRAQQRARDALAEANVRLTEAKARAEQARLAVREAMAKVETAQAQLESLEA
ncbi:MAG TPA: hypothetical protein VIH82_08605 [Acidimicrobiia bacterium]